MEVCLPSIEFTAGIVMAVVGGVVIGAGIASGVFLIVKGWIGKP